jgi:hypothetical protein
MPERNRKARLLGDATAQPHPDISDKQTALIASFRTGDRSPSQPNEAAARRPEQNAALYHENHCGTSDCSFRLGQNRGRDVSRTGGGLKGRQP